MMNDVFRVSLRHVRLITDTECVPESRFKLDCLGLVSRRISIRNVRADHVLIQKPQIQSCIQSTDYRIKPTIAHDSNFPILLYQSKFLPIKIKWAKFSYR